jgi:hypothetical protein
MRSVDETEAETHSIEWGMMAHGTGGHGWETDSWSFLSYFSQKGSQLDW